MKKSRRIIIIALSVFTIVILLTLTFGDRGFMDMRRLYIEEKKRSREIASLRAEIDALKNEIERLNNDTAYIERIARERLGMARKEEKIFQFVDQRE